jgi:hypothetical protein
MPCTAPAPHVIVFKPLAVHDDMYPTVSANFYNPASVMSFFWLSLSSQHPRRKAFVDNLSPFQSVSLVVVGYCSSLTPPTLGHRLFPLRVISLLLGGAHRHIRFGVIAPVRFIPHTAILSIPFLLSLVRLLCCFSHFPFFYSHSLPASA